MINIPFYCNYDSVKLLFHLLKKYDKDYINLYYIYNYYYDVYTYSFFYYRFCKRYVKKEFGMKIRRYNYKIGEKVKINFIFDKSFLKNKFLRLIYLINKDKINIINSNINFNYPYCYYIKIPEKYYDGKEFYDCFYNLPGEIIPVWNIEIKKFDRFKWENYIYFIPKKFK